MEHQSRWYRTSYAPEELTSGMRMLRYMHSGRNHVRTVMHLETGCRPSPRLAQNRGEETRTCTDCGKEETRAIEALGHDYKKHRNGSPAAQIRDIQRIPVRAVEIATSMLMWKLWDMTGNLRRLGSLQKQKVATGSTLVNGVTRPDERRFLPSALSPQTRSLRRIHLWMWKRGGSIMNRCFGLWRKESHLG